jgi:hypothetical protein
VDSVAVIPLLPGFTLAGYCSVRLPIVYIGFTRQLPGDSKFIIQKGFNE